MQQAELQKMSDEELIQQGTEQAYAALAVRYVYTVKCRAQAFSNSEIELEDLMQEGMIGFLKAARTYRADQGTSFHTYAVVCIDRSMISSIRSAKNAKKIPKTSMVSMDSSEHTEDRPLEEKISGRKGDNPETIVIAIEDQKRMEEKLNIILSPLERSALFLYLSGCNYDEISQHLGTTVKTVDNALQRVRRKLKQSN